MYTEMQSEDEVDNESVPENANDDGANVSAHVVENKQQNLSGYPCGGWPWEYNDPDHPCGEQLHKM
jgi:hypothetical protein